MRKTLSYIFFTLLIFSCRSNADKLNRIEVYSTSLNTNIYIWNIIINSTLSNFNTLHNETSETYLELSEDLHILLENNNRIKLEESYFNGIISISIIESDTNSDYIDSLDIVLFDINNIVLADAKLYFPSDTHISDEIVQLEIVETLEKIFNHID